jgi:hypothetical protein
MRKFCFSVNSSTSIASLMIRSLYIHLLRAPLRYAFIKSNSFFFYLLSYLISSGYFFLSSTLNHLFSFTYISLFIYICLSCLSNSVATFCPSFFSYHYFSISNKGLSRDTTDTAITNSSFSIYGTCSTLYSIW